MKKLTFFCVVAIAIILSGCNKNLSVQPHWTQLNSGTNSDLIDVFFSSPDLGYVLTDSNLILKTTNGGKTWRSLPIQHATEASSLFFTSERTGYVIDHNSYVLKTINGGESWDYAFGGYQDYYLTSMCFTSPDVGYVVGGKFTSYEGCILKTTDGGVTWHDLSNKIESVIFYTVYFIDDNTGIIAGDSGEIFKTTDGGNTWTKLNSETNALFIKSFFISPNTGYVAGGNKMGDGGKILKTMDGGNTWKVMGTGTRIITNLFFSSDHIGYALCSNAQAKGIILKTTDGGSTWSPEPFDEFPGYLSSVFFPEANTGYVVGQGGTIIKWGF
ncbi:MAG: hypothetical protein IH595_12975 [Bacteroidales bacterium]|nr:hypothetical protein [Bacteroidales bacterium]